MNIEIIRNTLYKVVLPSPQSSGRLACRQKRAMGVVGWWDMTQLHWAPIPGAYLLTFWLP